MDFGNFTVFDVFVKLDKLYLNLSIDGVPIESNELILKIDNKEIKFCQKIIKNNYEAALVLIYQLPKNFFIINKILTIYYNNKSHDLPFKTIETYPKNDDLVLTTLFKDDYKLFEIFYDYYTKQGVDYFYMYYNGKLNEEIKTYFNKKMLC